jgi:transposase
MHEPHTAHLERSRRLQAWHLKQQDWSQRQIAVALGVSEGAVSQWMARARDVGPEALRHRPPPVAPRRLSPEHLARVPALWHRGPTAYGCRGELWTRSNVVSPTTCVMSAVSKTLRWSPQKPMRRARQRDEAAVAQWRNDTWPAINKGRKPKGKPSSS